MLHCSMMRKGFPSILWNRSASVWQWPVSPVIEHKIKREHLEGWKWAVVWEVKYRIWKFETSKSLTLCYCFWQWTLFKDCIQTPLSVSTQSLQRFSTFVKRLMLKIRSLFSQWKNQQLKKRAAQNTTISQGENCFNHVCFNKIQPIKRFSK